MDSTLRKDLPIGVFIAAAVVVMASFMPWVTLKQSFPFGNLFPGGMQMKVSTPSPNAWNSNVTFMAITVPNWFVVGIACLAGFAAWASSAGRWNAPRGLLLGLPIYGLCHTAFVIVMVIKSRNPGLGLGFGVLLAFLAFGGMLVSVVKTSRPVTAPRYDPWSNADVSLREIQANEDS